MMHDDFGLAVTTDDPAALTAVNDFVQGVLRYETRGADVLRAAGCDCALVNAYCAILMLFLESPDAADQAKPHLDLAHAQSGGITRREAFTLAYAQAWADAMPSGDFRAVLAMGEDAVKTYPDDLILIKLHQYHCFNRGDAPAMLRAAQAAHKKRPAVAQVYGMLAFGYEQCHWLTEAEDAARTALDLEKKEPWAQHALAHVMLTQGRTAEGARFLEGVEDTWGGLNSFMLTHLWWHRALFYISLGRLEDALHIYDHHTLNADPSYTQDQIGAVALLARLDLAGIDIADRWTALGNLIRKRSGDTVLPFLSLHYVYCFAKAQRADTETLLAAIEAKTGETWTLITAPAARGLIAHARRDYATAFDLLGPTMPRFFDVGGSHAQRDLFEQIHLDAAMKAGHWVTAQQMIEARLRHDPHGVPLAKMREEINIALGIAQL